MANQSDLMGVGFSWPQAERVGYSPTSYVAVASVTTQSGATPIGSKLALLTVSTSTATSFLLPANPPTGIILYATNLFASTATASVFAATGNFLNGTTNTALTLTTGQSALFISETAGTAAACNWYSIKTA
jgi:hypothetical protein